METYFAGFWDALGTNRETFLELGRHEESWGTAFNMTVLALHTTARANGVSQLHGEVSRRMWMSVWQAKTPDEVPISAITNGVHVPTWIAWDMNKVFRKYLGTNWISARTIRRSGPAWERFPTQSCGRPTSGLSSTAG